MWSVVVCGDLWWSVVVCGDLWWSVVFRLTPIGSFWCRCEQDILIPINCIYTIHICFTDIDECIDTSLCGIHTCVNTIGSFWCTYLLYRYR